MKKIETQVEIFSSYYNDLTELRAMIMAVPLIGSQLDLYLSTPGQKYAQERVEFMIMELQNDIDEIKDIIIDSTFFDTEEGYDLVQKTFSASARTRQKEKLKLFARIIKGALTHKDKQYDPELYLKIVEELSVRELEIALLLFDVKEKRKIKVEGENEAKYGMTDDPSWFSKHYPQYSKDELEYILPRLEKTGLVKELVGSFIGNGGGKYFPTRLFSDFINFIEQND